MASRNRLGGLRRLPLGGWLMIVFLTIGLTATFAFTSTSRSNIASIWPCNGLLTAFLLSSRRKRWVPYSICGFLGILSASLIFHYPLLSSILLSAIDSLEAFLAAWIINPSGPRKVDLTNPNYFARFFGGAVLLAPLLSTLSASFVVSGTQAEILHTLLHWFPSNALGMAIIPPMALAVYENPPSSWINKREFAALFALLLLVTLAIFLQSTAPLLFVVYPILQFICIRLGLGAATIGVFLTAVIGGTLTAQGHGPLALMQNESMSGRILYLQFFLALALFMNYIASIVLAQRDRIASAMRKNSVLYRLVTEYSRDIIVLADLEGRRLYVSPAIKEVLGYQPEELLNHPLNSLAHPDDQAEYLKVLSNLRNGQDGQSFTYRNRKKSGAYVWVEGNIRLYRQAETGQPIGFLNVVRDISRRKKDEEELKRAYRAVEALAVVDALTGIANRRRFDEVLAQEWRRGIREGKSLSLLLLDVDFFKRYNDHYGHVRGDSCLKQIAEAALDVVSRPADLIARFGGEEFAIILPNTPQSGACDVAEQVRTMVQHRALPHVGNPYGVVTVSIGCATLVPQRGMNSLRLIEVADQALYTAKHKGRNCIVASETTTPEVEEAKISAKNLDEAAKR